MKFFKVLGIFAILVFSFYYTDKIALLVQEKNPVLQEIKSNMSELEVTAVDATIDQDTIIPGITGSKVNVQKSFYNMKPLKTYNEAYLVYDNTLPTVSLQNNKDKIIISGNKSKKNVAIIFENASNFISELQEYDIDILVTKDSYINNSRYELINNEKNKKLFNQVNSMLNNDKLNKNLCLYDEDNKDLCLNNKNYLVKYTHKLESNNIIDVKNTIDNGSIILISKSAKESDIKILLKQIKFQDLDIVYLSKLIEE